MIAKAIMPVFCTYLDHRYLPRGLAMIESLSEQTTKYVLYALALDDVCYDALHRAAVLGVIPIRLPDLEANDPELAATRARRSQIEYYFTLTASLPLYVLALDPEIDIITYIDSDLYFFADPNVALAEMGEASVAIVGHRFSEAARGRQQYGVYNVGWVSWRNDAAGRACLSWYRERCLEWCFDSVEPGRYADQKYLDDWPVRFGNVRVIRHPGCNVAPWNLEESRISGEHDRLSVCGKPLVFFHFHGLKSLFEFDAESTGIADYVTVAARLDLDLIHDGIYRPYIAAACRARAALAALNLDAPRTSDLLRVAGQRPQAYDMPRWRSEWDWVPGENFRSTPPQLHKDRSLAVLAMARHRQAREFWTATADGQKRLCLEVAFNEVARIQEGPITIFDWGGMEDGIPAIEVARRSFGHRLRRYLVLEALASGPALEAASPEIGAAGSLEAALSGIPNLIYAGALLWECTDWPAVLRRLCTTGMETLLLDVRVVSGRPSFRAIRRQIGTSDKVAVSIVNRAELGASLAELGLIVVREWVWFDSVLVPNVLEPAESRTLLVRGKDSWMGDARAADDLLVEGL